MKIAIPKESLAGERRVAMVPDLAKRLVGDGVTVCVERNAGRAAGFPDAAYSAVGAEIVSDAAVFDADLVLKLHIPTATDEAPKLRAGTTLVGLFYPTRHLDAVRALQAGGVTALSLDLLPRITRAQSMDVLSSMSTVTGYKAVLLGAGQLGKLFPMLVTAAGTIAPSKVLVLGAGVAGLQAIATARRLGAVVRAFDVRPAAKEQVESLGATFIDVPTAEDAETAGGYAKELGAEQAARNREAIREAARDVDVIVTTALIPGKPAPELIPAATVEAMRPGSVIVDLAAEAGGNCALTTPGETREHEGVTILAPVNLAATVPTHASQMFAKNLSTFVNHIWQDGTLTVDLEDEITGAVCVTHDGRIVHEPTRAAAEGGSGS